MKIKDIQANTGKIDVQGVIIDIQKPTENKFGKVASAILQDESGVITLSLWNEQAESFGIGDMVHIINGYCKEYKNEKQLSAGKYGSIEIVTEAKEAEPAKPTAKPKGKKKIEEEDLEDI